MRSTWYTRWYQLMHEVLEECQEEGKEPLDIARAIDDAYPYTHRQGWPYKAWLRCKKDFSIKHQIPLRHMRKPKGDDLFYETAH